MPSILTHRGSYQAYQPYKGGDIGLSFTFKIPRYFEKSQASDTSARFIHPQATRIEVIIKEGNTEVTKASTTFDDSKEDVTLYIENVPMNKELNLEAKVYKDDDLVGSCDTKIDPITTKKPSPINITIIPDGEDILNLELVDFWNGYGYEFGYDENDNPNGIEFEEEKFYVFKIPNLDKGVYGIYWYNLETIPEMELYKSNGEKHTQLTKIITFEKDGVESAAEHFFGIMDAQDVYLVVYGNNTASENIHLNIHSFGDSILMLSITEDTGLIDRSAIENNGTLKFICSGETVEKKITLALYNVYETPVSLKSHYFANTKADGFTLTTTASSNEPILPGKKYDFEFDIIYNREKGEGQDKEGTADFKLNFGTDLPPLVIELLGSKNPSA